MHNNIPLTHTVTGIVVCVLVSYVLTVFAAWLTGHPTPFKFWSPIE